MEVEEYPDISSFPSFYSHCAGVTHCNTNTHSFSIVSAPLKITCSNISKSREALVNQGFPAHKKITVPTAPMSVKTVIVSARSGVRTLDTLIKSQVLYQLS